MKFRTEKFGFFRKILLVVCVTIMVLFLVWIKFRFSENIVSDSIIIPDKYNTGVAKEIRLINISDILPDRDVIYLSEDTLAIIDPNKDGIIENIRFSGTTINTNKYIPYDNMKFINCIFDGKGMFDYAVIHGDYYGGEKALMFEHCEIMGYKSSVTSPSLNAQFSYSYIHDMYADGIKQGNVQNYAENCYIANMGLQEGSHADGVQTASGTCRLVNCRFEMPGVEPYCSNACIFSTANFGNIVLDIDTVYVNGGGYSIYFSTDEKNEFTVTGVAKNIKCGCACKYGAITGDNGVDIQIADACSLYVGSIWKEGDTIQISVTNDTNKEHIINIKTNNGDVYYTIPKCLEGGEITGETTLDDFPFDLIYEIPSKGVKWVKCYDGGQLIRTQVIK